MKIVIVSPYRMDAALGLGLAVDAWLEQGHAVEVVNCFTRSEHAPHSDADSVHANDRLSFVSALRKREDEAWQKLYRSAKLTLTDLNLKDAPLRLHCAPEEVFSVAVNESDKSFAKIAKALEQRNDEAVLERIRGEVVGGCRGARRDGRQRAEAGCECDTDDDRQQRFVAPDFVPRVGVRLADEVEAAVAVVLAAAIADHHPRGNLRGAHQHGEG